MKISVMARMTDQQLKDVPEVEFRRGVIELLDALADYATEQLGIGWEGPSADDKDEPSADPVSGE